MLSGRLRHIFLIFSPPEVLGGDFDTTRRDLMSYNQAYDQKSEEKAPKTQNEHIPKNNNIFLKKF